jgi:hypothetical protein
MIANEQNLLNVSSQGREGVLNDSFPLNFFAALRFMAR